MNYLRPALLLTALLSAGLAHGDTDSFIEGIERCSKVDNDIARLQCFDRISSNFLSEQAKIAEAYGDWRVGSEVDPIDDTVITMLVTESVNAEKSLFGEGKHTFVLRCTGTQLETYIVWNQMYGDGGPLTVISRAGEYDADTDKWSSSTNRKASFYPGNTAKLLYKLLRSDRFVARIPYRAERGKEITAIFNIKGLEAAAKHMNDRCTRTMKPVGVIGPEDLAETLAEHFKKQGLQ